MIGKIRSVYYHKGNYRFVICFNEDHILEHSRLKQFLKNKIAEQEIKGTNPTFVFLQETNLPSIQIQEISKKLWKGSEGIDIDPRGYVGGLGILWDPNIVKLEGFHGNKCFISAEFKVISFSIEGVVTNVYGPHNAGEKKSFINSLEKIHEERKGRHWVWSLIKGLSSSPIFTMD